MIDSSSQKWRQIRESKLKFSMLRPVDMAKIWFKKNWKNLARLDRRLEFQAEFKIEDVAKNDFLE